MGGTGHPIGEPVLKEYWIRMFVEAGLIALAIYLMVALLLRAEARLTNLRKRRKV